MLACHTSIGYGGHHHMIQELNNKYKNISWNDVQIFLQLCEPCKKIKQKEIKKGIIVNQWFFRNLIHVAQMI